MKKVQVQQQKECRTKIMRKVPVQRSSSQKYLSSKTLSRCQTNILLRGLKFTPTPKRNNIELKSNIQNYARRFRLAEFYQNKEGNDSENLFQKQSAFTPP